MKPQLPKSKIHHFLRAFHSIEPVLLPPISEGLESQVLAYKLEQEEYIIRLNQEISGYLKEKYCSDHFSTTKLPMPEIIDIGAFDTEHFYCITKRIPGITLEDSDNNTLTHLTDNVAHILDIIHNVDISKSTGFGPFDKTGVAHFTSWHTYLSASVDHKDWNALFKSNLLDRTIIVPMLDTFQRLIETSPEVRCLVHGDFGANNVLTDGKKITGVIDWENALYGDPLHDIAGIYFWAPWLDCMQIQANYFESQNLTSKPHRSRILCYQLKYGLEEIYGSAVSQDTNFLNWAIRRTLQIYRTTKS